MTEHTIDFGHLEEAVMAAQQVIIDLQVDTGTASPLTIASQVTMAVLPKILACVDDTLDAARLDTVQARSAAARARTQADDVRDTARKRNQRLKTVFEELNAELFKDQTIAALRAAGFQVTTREERYILVACGQTINRIGKAISLAVDTDITTMDPGFLEP